MIEIKKKFQRTREDFTCGHCGRMVQGDGYTNHCPTCLWSQHVDVNPGDRQNPCQGLMEPIGLELKNGASVIHHRCIRCGVRKKNRTAPYDDQLAVTRLSGRPIIGAT